MPKIPAVILCIASTIAIYIMCIDYFGPSTNCDSYLLVCFSDALLHVCNWLHEADWQCSLACYQTDGQTGKDNSVTLRNTAGYRRRKNTHIDTKTDQSSTSGHALQTHTDAKAHASVVILSDCDSKVSLLNVSLLDDTRIRSGDRTK